ncbi:MAG: ATP-binding cassette domain-containing protein [Spirochaetaceae bacterium]|jgi:peptide/nickel transport system ATP-binding protein|nr:ATP-binding cassette domain-containing protein [Spirochaetaceae bacterium]
MRLEMNNVGFRYEGAGKLNPWIFRGVNLSFESGCRTALLGDSGSGKTTLGKLLAHYEKPSEGKIVLPGAVFGKGCYPVQLILQHPETAVNPRFKMRDILTEGWMPEENLLKRLGIEHAWLNRYPQEMSGGELQRFCIARALAPATRFIVADEITAMFDLITQAQIWEAVLEETGNRNIGIIVITHDRDLGRRVCGETILMEELTGLASRPRN